MRLRAYYYEFDPTGVDLVDRILSAVACAGKAFHHTESWNEPIETPYEPIFRGRTPRDWIQEAANDAATALGALDAERAAHAATRETTMCGYCGDTWRGQDEETRHALMLEHVAVCEKRPELKLMALLMETEDERDTLRAHLARLDALLNDRERMGRLIEEAHGHAEWEYDEVRRATTARTADAAYWPSFAGHLAAKVRAALDGDSSRDAQ